MLKNKTLLITGGTGSFGNAVLKRFLDTEVSEIRIFSRDEKKQDEMRQNLHNDKVKFYIGDVRDFNSINSAMQEVDYVFCAAALKQVPSCEFYPIEAVRTNILGTENTLHAAKENGVKNVIVLSTDKAVYPINAMGMSKALMEKVAIAKARSLGNHIKPTICVTRYGNVMASRGSVIPLFTSQIKEGKPLTVTDPHMTRFMMSLDDSVDLVLFAYQNGNSGDIFVQKAPATTIAVLVEALKTIFNADNDVRIIGTRHGEKKHETLLNREELMHAEDLINYYRIPSDTRDLNYEKYFEEGEDNLSIEQDYTSGNTQRLERDELIEMLLKLDYIQQELAE
jgi:UDP-glucose 4-epimerase